MWDHLPPTSLLASSAWSDGYRDCFTVPLGPAPVTLDDAIPAFFHAAPAWFDTLMGLRNALVKPFGLKTGVGAAPVLAPPFHVGQSIGVFRLVALTPDEAVFGEDDRHLDFRTSLLLRRTEQGQSLTFSTVVKVHNGLGRCYLAVVKPFHRMIVPIMAGNTARLLQKTM
ncbi:MAG TPA: DUF2867 domain-containing protein [Azospirillum sp.]|nr:DUF2867 domain-containing protein [Azospirillum sp.]